MKMHEEEEKYEANSSSLSASHPRIASSSTSECAKHSSASLWAPQPSEARTLS